MAFMSRATAYRRISHAVQANVRAILVAAGEGINAEENLSRVAFTSNQPEVPEPPLNCSLSQVESARGLYGGVQPEVPESPLNRSLGQVASAGIYGGVLESCDVEYHTGDSMHSVPVEPDNVPDGCHRCLTQQDTATDSNSNTYEKAKDKLIALEYSSDSNSGRELGRGKRKRQRALRYEDDEEDGSTDDGERDQYVQPRAPTPPQRLSMTGKGELVRMA
ncbi:hypothetical protein MTO96_052169 [Rhipicephalus appendiculatus]